MLLGIDVGGTFTDAVAVVEGKIAATVKTPTTARLLDGILAAVDAITAKVGHADFSRVSLSTTVVTNALLTGRGDRVGLCLLPGPGMALDGQFPTEPYILPGYSDHRGREIIRADKDELAAMCKALAGYDAYAVSGKFAVRNPQGEQAAGAALAACYPAAPLALGANMAGTLNFIRRTNSAYYNAAVARTFAQFAEAVTAALTQRGIHAPVYILKADGGTLPLQAARECPVETVFTGPAASVLGIMALVGRPQAAVSLDIGGTTTDIALWENGAPLFASRGAQIGRYPTAVRAFRLRSIPVGGDSSVRWDGQQIQIGPQREGPAMAVGGPMPTVSDAMVAAGLVDFGDRMRAESAMRRLALPGETVERIAAAVLKTAARQIALAVQGLIEEQASEPVYRVEDIVQGSRLEPQQIIGVGGAAGGLVPLVAEAMGLAAVLPSQGGVANALGAAVARPTVAVTLRADTEAGWYTVAELGLRAKLPARDMTLATAEELARDHLAQRAAQAGVPLGAAEVVMAEEFALVRGFRTVGRVLTCQLQMQPGVLHQMAEEVQP